MKSICYIVLPSGLSQEHEMVCGFIKTQIGRYHIEYEVEPYKKFFSEEETIAIARRKGYHSVLDFKASLERENDDDGIENNRYYWITTYNPQGHWDYFILEEIKACRDLRERTVPSSFVDMDGMWHSEQEYGYKPILDFELNAQHPDNAKAECEWRAFLDRTLFDVFLNHRIAVLTVHS